MQNVLKSIGVVAVLALFAAVAWLSLRYNAYPSPPQIQLVNLSDHTLRDVTLSGEGFTKAFPAVAPHVTEEFSVRPNRESGCEIAFTVNGRLYQKDDLAYLEASGGYFLNITIQTNLEIEAHSGFNDPVKR